MKVSNHALFARPHQRITPFVVTQQQLQRDLLIRKTVLEGGMIVRLKATIVPLPFEINSLRIQVVQYPLETLGVSDCLPETT
jgi:hypothetical protein